MDINSQAERYKQEMLKLYGKRQSGLDNGKIPEPTQKSREPVQEVPVQIPEIPEPAEESRELTENVPPTDEEIFGVDENASDDSAYSPHSEEYSESTPETEDEYNTKYPEPDLSELDNNIFAQENTSPPEYISEESMGTSKGYILVNVRTGDESSAIQGASVMVTAIVDGSRLILASGVTNMNGTTQKFVLPAPDVSQSQTPNFPTRPYNLFDVSVTAEGFFNARSVDVPVFAGITSIQNFNMIPLPSMMRENDETVTYFNQEPNFPNSQKGE